MKPRNWFIGIASLLSILLTATLHYINTTPLPCVAFIILSICLYLLYYIVDSIVHCHFVSLCLCTTCCWSSDLLLSDFCTSHQVKLNPDLTLLTFGLNLDWVSTLFCFPVREHVLKVTDRTRSQRLHWVLELCRSAWLKKGFISSIKDMTRLDFVLQHTVGFIKNEVKVCVRVCALN